MAAARAAYVGALDVLESAVGELSEGMALSNWASDPSASFKVRGLRAVPLSPTADRAMVDVVLAALRELVEPRQRPSMRSPFSGPAPDPEAPAVEPTPAPAA